MDGKDQREHWSKQVELKKALQVTKGMTSVRGLV